MQIRDRITELRRVRAGDLHASPKNWRTHPAAQVAALRGVLGEIGYADALLVRVLPGGDLELIDGHCRKELDPNQIVPVLITDLTEAEADKLLLTLDPLAAMAEADSKALDILLSNVTTENEGLQALLDSMGGCESDKPVELKKIEVRPPPKMTWALIGIPTVRFGEIASQIESLATVDGLILETTSNDE